MDFASSLEFWARSAPERIAVANVHEELTFLDLALRAQAFSRRLQDVEEARVGICTSDPVTMAVGFFASVLADKSLAILDPAWPSELFLRLSQQLGVRSVISEVPLAEETGSLMVQLDPPKVRPDNPLLPLTQHLASRELLVICTSGSTGLPKAIVRTQDSWQQSIHAGAALLGAVPSAVTICPGPVSHGLSLYALMESIVTGGTMIATGRFNLSSLIELAELYACTRLVSVPTIIDRVCREVQHSSLASLRTVVSGGEPLQQDTVDRLFSLPSVESCVEYYGSSEHSLIAYRHRHAPEEPGKTFKGTLFPGVEVHIHDQSPNAGFGSLFVDSPFIATGYDAGTAVQIDRCGTSTGIGDQGRISHRGQLELQGRGGSMFNIHGNNIHPKEITLAFGEIGLPGVRVDAEVRDGRTLLVAYAVLGHAALEELADQLARKLPTYKIPHELVLLSSWPTTASGKSLVHGYRNYEELVVKRVALR